MLWYSLEAPRRGASNEYPQHMFSSTNKKNIMWIPPLICSYDIIARIAVLVFFLCTLVVSCVAFLVSLFLSRLSFFRCLITKTGLFKYIENFTTKNWNLSDKNADIFHISAQNIDCGYSLEPPCRSMFLSRNKKNNVYPCKPEFYYIKVGFEGVKLYRHVFVMSGRLCFLIVAFF